VNLEDYRVSADFLGLWPGPLAYIDPGTGSVVMQLLLGGVAGIAIVFRLFWGRLKERFVGKPSPGKTDTDDATPND
jgi:hypothetical protein